MTKIQLTAALLAASFLVACGTNQTPTPAPTVQPSATPVIVRGDPNYTPVPAPVTQSALDTIRQSGEVRIGILYNNPPFAYLAQNGDIHGFDTDLLRKMAEHWEVKPVFVQVTRQTRIPALLSGKIDLIAASVPHRRELGQFVEFTGTTFQSGIGVFVSNDSGINAPTDLNGRVVALIGNESQETWNAFSANSGVTATTQVYPDTNTAVAAFSQQGGPQAIVGRVENLMQAATMVSNVRTLGALILSEPYAFAVRRGDTPFRDFLDLSLQQLIKSGEYGQIYTANLYGAGATGLVPMTGDPAYTLQNFPSTVSAGESIIARMKRGEGLKVGGFGGGASQPPPYDGQAIVDGYNRAVINELARRWNAPIQEIPETAGQTGIDALRAGQLDLVVGVRPNLSMLGSLTLSQGYYQRGLRLIHMEGVTLLGIGDLNYKAVSIIEPLDVSQDLVQKNSEGARITQAPSNEEAFKSLTSGSAYGLVGDEFSVMLMARADDRIDVIDERYRAANYVMAIRPGDADFLNLVNFTLQNMKIDGTLDRLIEQYFGPYAPADEPFEPVPLDVWPGDGSYLGVGGP